MNSYLKKLNIKKKIEIVETAFNRNLHSNFSV